MYVYFTLVSAKTFFELFILSTAMLLRHHAIPPVIIETYLRISYGYKRYIISEFAYLKSTLASAMNIERLGDLGQVMLNQIDVFKCYSNERLVSCRGPVSLHIFIARTWPADWVSFTRSTYIRWPHRLLLSLH